MLWPCCWPTACGLNAMGAAAQHSGNHTMGPPQAPGADALIQSYEKSRQQQQHSWSLDRLWGIARALVKLVPA